MAGDGETRSVSAAEASALRGWEFLVTHRSPAGLWRPPLATSSVDYSLSTVCLSVGIRLHDIGQAEITAALDHEFFKLEHRSLRDIGPAAGEFVIREAIRRRKPETYVQKRLEWLLDGFSDELTDTVQALARNVYLIEMVHAAHPRITTGARRARILMDRQVASGGWPARPGLPPDAISTAAALVATSRSLESAPSEGLRTRMSRAHIEGLHFLEDYMSARSQADAARDAYLVSWVLRALASGRKIHTSDLVTPLCNRLLDLQLDNGAWAKPGGPGSIELTARSCLALACVSETSTPERSGTSRPEIASVRTDRPESGNVAGRPSGNPSLEDRARRPQVASHRYDSTVDTELRRTGEDHPLLDLVVDFTDLLERSRHRGYRQLWVGAGAMIVGVTAALVDLTSIAGGISTGIIAVVVGSLCAWALASEYLYDRENSSLLRELKEEASRVEDEYDNRIERLIDLFREVFADTPRGPLRAFLHRYGEMVGHLDRRDLAEGARLAAEAAGLSPENVALASNWARELALLDLFSREQVVQRLRNVV